jgi:hypothetical protein
MCADANHAKNPPPTKPAPAPHAAPFASEEVDRRTRTWSRRLTANLQPYETFPTPTVKTWREAVKPAKPSKRFLVTFRCVGNRTFHETRWFRSDPTHPLRALQLAERRGDSAAYSDDASETASRARACRRFVCLRHPEAESPVADLGVQAGLDPVIVTAGLRQRLWPEVPLRSRCTTELEDVPEFRVPDIRRNGYEVWRRQAVTLKQQKNYPQRSS